jgi:hypothetical protein
MVGPMKTPFASLCLVSLVFSAAACGDDDERDPPPFSSGVQSEAPVSELTPTEKRQICDQYGAHVQANVDLRQVAYAVCLPSSLLFGGTSEQSCEQFLNDCASNFLVEGQLRARVNDVQGCLADLDQCQASVAELEGCVNLNLDLVYNILERLSCRRAGDRALMNEARDFQVGQVCSAPNRVCGEFAETPIQ